ncbi:MAG: glycosyltransferase family 39 protein [Planctomycetes bacterium]|nr:glycosyltransferase family 39 protein [Planctomycetota bacterium]
MLRSLAGERALILLVALTGFWLCVAMPVFAQESYYWCYSEHPDLSYYDHPPMVAWLIWLGTALFGDGALGIRLGTWLCGCAITGGGLGLLRAFDAPPTARKTWLVLCLGVPSLVAARFLTNPDPALCAFWMLTVLALWKARSGGLGWWVLAGFLAGCALLGKYTGAFLAVSGAIVLLFDPQMRRQLLRPGPYLGVVVAALTFLPVIWWNVANDFESFRFQTTGRWTKAELGVEYLGAFVGGQIAMIHPLIAVLVPATLLWLWRRARATDIRARWLLAFSVPMLLFLLLNSILVKVKINWGTPAQLTLLLGVAMWWADTDFTARRPRWAKVTVGAVLAVAFAVMFAPAMVLVPQPAGSTWTGWLELAARAEHWQHELDAEDGVAGNVFYFAGDYRDSAQLARGLKLEHAAHPDRPLAPVLAQNVVGIRGLQFDHWTPPRSRIGQNAVFVLPRPERRNTFLEMVEARFGSVEKVDHIAVTRLGIEVLDADIYVCRDYRGPDL